MPVPKQDINNLLREENAYSHLRRQSQHLPLHLLTHASSIIPKLPWHTANGRAEAMNLGAQVSDFVNGGKMWVIV